MHGSDYFCCKKLMHYPGLESISGFQSFKQENSLSRVREILDSCQMIILHNASYRLMCVYR